MRMNTRTIVVRAAAVCALCFSGSTALAEPIVELEGTSAVGIRGFEHDGVLFDITFDARSFDAITAAFDDPFPFVGTNSFDASGPVLEEINLLLEGAGATRVRDPLADLDAFRGIIPVRFESLADPDAFVGQENQFLGGDWRIAFSGGGVGFDRGVAAGDRGRVFMAFHAVPEPSSLAILAMGFGLVLGRVVLHRGRA